MVVVFLRRVRQNWPTIKGSRMDGDIEGWKVMDWLQAAVHIMGLVGGIAAGCIFVAKKARRFAKFKYPAQGEAGRNMLAPGVEVVSQWEHRSMSAVVPEDRTLVVILEGEPAAAPAAAQLIAPLASSMGPMWGYSIAPAPLNWRSNRYRDATGETKSSQTFTARAGDAEIDLQFSQPGVITVHVHENGDPSPMFTKKIRVEPVEIQR